MGLDLGLATIGGYLLRAEPLALALVDGAALLPLVAATLAGLGLLARSRWPIAAAFVGRPVTLLLLAATLPLATLRARYGPDPAGLVAALALLSFPALALWWEPRAGSAARRRGGMLFVAGVAGLTLLTVLLSPSPGDDLLAAPEQRPQSSATPGAPNLILIVLDTVRADHLGTYGAPRPSSPALDRLADTSTVFEWAVSSSSYTLPAHATLFTGLYPRSHGADVVHDGGGVSLRELGLQADRARVSALAEEARALAEIARDQGLATGAICANTAYLHRAFGLDQGFESYVDVPGLDPSWRPAGLTLLSLVARRLPASWSWRFERLLTSNERYYLLAPEVNRLAFRWLAPRREGRFFLFLNYMDAHAPYLPLGRYRDLYPAAAALPEIDRPAILRGDRPILPAERAVLVDSYDAEIRYLDDHLGELFERLESWQLLETTLIVIVGDHGESFGEHARLDHATSVYEDQVRIPLIYRAPGQREARRVGHPVHLADVFPTILDGMGFEPLPDVDGASLWARERRLPIVAYLGPYERDFDEHAVYSDPWKLIRRSTGETELYDVRIDREELHDVSADHPELVARLGEALDRFAAAVEPRFPASASPDDEETLRRLKALGYLD